MKNLAFSEEGERLPGLARSKLVDCVCLSVCRRLIPVQLALRQGFQNPPAGRAGRHSHSRWRDGRGRKRGSERGLMWGGWRGVRRRAATH